MKRCFTTILFMTTVFSYAQTLAGKYDSDGGKRRFKIEINPDGTYVQYSKDCTFKIETTGSWKMNKDTIDLKFDKMYRIGENKNDKHEMTPESINYNLIASLNKLVVKPDTLVLLYVKPDTLILPKNKIIPVSTLHKVENKKH